VNNSAGGTFTDLAFSGITGTNGANLRHQHPFTTGVASASHDHNIGLDGAHAHAGSSAATAVTVDNSTAQENIPNTFVVITCVKT
jgi:hypothetical protein